MTEDKPVSDSVVYSYETLANSTPDQIGNLSILLDARKWA